MYLLSIYLTPKWTLTKVGTLPIAHSRSIWQCQEQPCRREIRGPAVSLLSGRNTEELAVLQGPPVVSISGSRKRGLPLRVTLSKEALETSCSGSGLSGCCPCQFHPSKIAPQLPGPPHGMGPQATAQICLASWKSSAEILYRISPALLFPLKATCKVERKVKVN